MKEGMRKIRRPAAMYLNSKDPKDDKKRTADEDDVPDGLQGRDQSLHHQLEAWSSTDNPEKRKKG